MILEGQFLYQGHHLNYKLDIQNEEILNFFFDAPEAFQEDLFEIKKSVIGKSFKDVLVLDRKFNPLFLFLHDLINDYIHPDLAIDKGDLICRCFGVSRVEINNYLKTTSSFELKDMTATIKAGGGCTSCLGDLKHLTNDYLITNPPKEDKSDDEIICNCFGISKKEILDFISAESPKSVEEITDKLNAGGGCRSCLGTLESLLEN